MLDAQAALEASDPQPGTLDIELVAPHLDGLADPRAVPVDHEQKGVVANSGAPLLGGLEQAIDLRTVQKILRTLVKSVVAVLLFTFRLLVAIGACLESACSV